MLTPQQYEAIGRFALAFNEIEYYLEAYIAAFLRTPEWAVASVVAEEGTFSAKLRRFTRALSAIDEQHPALKNATEAAAKFAKEAGKLAEKRNEYIHALVIKDLGPKQQSNLRVRRTIKPFNDAEVAALTAQAQELADKLNDASAGVLVMLDQP
jgi:hypothetical protein